MGILRNGILGGISGRVGNLVSYRILDKEVIRIRGKNKTPPSEKQLMNRHDMAVVNAFLRPGQEFVKVGFALAAKKDKMYPHNKAVSHHKKYALKGSYPNREIDFSQVRLSQGNLAALQNLDIELKPAGLYISWVKTNDFGWESRSDQVMVLIYFPELSSPQAHYNLNAAKRADGECLLTLPPTLCSCAMEVYVSMISENRKKISDSQYLGSFNR